MLSGILDRTWTFWSGLYWRAVPQLGRAVVTAPETPAGTPSEFLAPVTSAQGQGLQVQAVLGLQGDLGPVKAERLVPRGRHLQAPGSQGSIWPVVRKLWESLGFREEV